MKIRNYLATALKYKDDICLYLLLALAIVYAGIRIHYFRVTKASMYVGDVAVGNTDFYGIMYFVMACIAVVWLYDKPRRYLYLVLGFLLGYCLSLMPITSII